MALRQFLDQVFNSHFSETPPWVNRELFREAWTEDLLADLLDQGETREETEFRYLLSDSLLTPLCSEQFDPSASGGVNGEVEEILVPAAVCTELRALLAKQPPDDGFLHGHVDVEKFPAENGWWYRTRENDPEFHGREVFVNRVIQDTIVASRTVQYVGIVTERVQPATEIEARMEIAKFFTPSAVKRKSK